MFPVNQARHWRLSAAAVVGSASCPTQLQCANLEWTNVFMKRKILLQEAFHVSRSTSADHGNPITLTHLAPLFHFPRPFALFPIFSLRIVIPFGLVGLTVEKYQGTHWILLAYSNHSHIDNAGSNDRQRIAGQASSPPDTNG